MNHSQHNSIISFIWGIADDVLRDVFVRGKYRDVILPMTVLRRLDALLEPTKQRVLETNKFLEEHGIDDKSALSGENGSGLPFFNTSEWTLTRLAHTTEKNELGRRFVEYLDGFSDNVRDIIDKFRLRDQIKTLVEADALLILIQRFTDGRINLSPDAVLTAYGATVHEGLDNRGMGYVFEELLRKFNEENNEEAGEHFTPRDIIELMTHLVFDPVLEKLAPNAPYHIYDDACGSGGMLTLAKEFLETRADKTGNQFNIRLYGQEVNPETFAICQSDMLISGQDTKGIAYGSTLSQDGHKGQTFDFMMANPPYGKSWKKDQEHITDAKTKDVFDDRFIQTLSSGERLRLVPASSDGQLLFTVNMLTKMKTQTSLGSRIAVVHNGSALFTGDAGSGESNIRRWMLENDWLEAIIGLPLRMFYNTGIATYIWVFSNRKPEHRKGKVQLIDASNIHGKLRKNLGQKSHVFEAPHIAQIIETFMSAPEYSAVHSKWFDNEDFLYRKVLIERPLRLRTDLSKRAENDDKLNAIIARLETKHGAGPHREYSALLAGEKLNAATEKKLRAVCCTIDETAEPLKEADAQLRDWENVPFKEDPQEYFEREVLPHAPDAWMDESKTSVGAEISFTRYFYQAKPLRPLSEITQEILNLEQQSENLLHRLAGELTS